MNYSNTIIDDILQKFKTVMGPHYDRYKNHVYRVFLNCLLIDNEKNNEEKYSIAAAFHDIGIWTNHTFDYLDPSVEQAKIYLTETGRPEWIEEVSLMINWHHKISEYRGVHEKIVESFRKADWIDFSLGLRTFGFDKRKIKENKRNLPNLGFHLFLVKETTKNFIRHPFNPLPMFKK
jgi:HD domain